MASCCLFISACGDQPSRSIFLETEEASGIPDPPETFADLINPFAGDQGAALEGEVHPVTALPVKVMALHQLDWIRSPKTWLSDNQN
jgi:hypothetical protein